MNLSYNWLSELLVTLETDADGLTKLITMKTAECEGVHPFGADIPGCTPDSIIEIDNKSLTHRPDLWGHFGLAREVAAILRIKLRDPVRLDLLPSGRSPYKIAIENANDCLRYSALMFENVTVCSSPLWLQCRLRALGMNAINNIVDVTNYVMAELGQPMHAFDADLLRGDTIFICPAPPGAAFTGLNDQSYVLDQKNLVIADAGGPIALAGIIGGRDSAISGKTDRVVLESANFNASLVRKTSASLKLRTDASMRFEKGQDSTNTVRGLARAIELLQEVSPGIRLVGGLADQKRNEAPLPPITLSLDWLDKKLGHAIPEAEVRDILERLQFGVADASPRVFEVSVPSWRGPKDISIREDLVEEVGRMVGYGVITPLPPQVFSTVPVDDPRRLFRRQLSAMLVAQGFTEVHNYSFISDEQARALALDLDLAVTIANPISAEQTLMRSSLLPGILKNVLENSKHFESFRLFEIGSEIRKQASGLPREILHAAIVMYHRDGDSTDLFELKRIAECLMPRIDVRPTLPQPFEHPARASEVFCNGEAVGRLFEFHPSLLDTGNAAVLYLDLEKMLQLPPAEKRYRPVRRFPDSTFDLSVVAKTHEPVGTIQKRMEDLAGGALESIEFLRQYSGPPLPDGYKSASFRLRVAAPDHTLSLEEAGLIRRRIIEGLEASGYEFRT